MASTIFGVGAILLGILIAGTEGLNWPRWLHYVWAGIAVLWGVVAFLV